MRDSLCQQVHGHHAPSKTSHVSQHHPEHLRVDLGVQHPAVLSQPALLYDHRGGIPGRWQQGHLLHVLAGRTFQREQPRIHVRYTFCFNL
ncbi:hypothetical protein CDAR_385801 [Caerostris darwini]|uniref:Uncharacterized protein n=1 Tax=Caerostris darwini TaxID=1538125 RepID=A0AAV4N5T8_9ARAC|nr:hypothetical protein CDAR_385801 [Caerostris darwini]